MKDTIQMACEAGFSLEYDGLCIDNRDGMCGEELKRFESLVRADERERLKAAQPAPDKEPLWHLVIKETGKGSLFPFLCEFGWTGDLLSKVGIGRHAVYAAAQPAVPEEIMHWDGDDGEDGPHDDIASLLNNMLCNRDLEVGEKIHITRATRLPDVWVRVTKIPEDADVEYEVITAAAPEKGGAA